MKAEIKLVLLVQILPVADLNMHAVNPLLMCIYLLVFLSCEFLNYDSQLILGSTPINEMKNVGAL